jgi:hypothetical protein
METQVPSLAYRLQRSIFGSCPGHDLHNRHRCVGGRPFLAPAESCIHPCTNPCNIPALKPVLALGARIGQYG